MQKAHYVQIIENSLIHKQFKKGIAYKAIPLTCYPTSLIKLLSDKWVPKSSRIIVLKGYATQTNIVFNQAIGFLDPNDQRPWSEKLKELRKT